MVYYSQLKDNYLYDSKNIKLGKLKDLIFQDGKNYAEVTDIVYIDEDKNKKKIPWTYVKEFKEERNGSNGTISIHLNTPIENITPFFIKKTENFVGEILDKQVIDVNGVKIVRVNDVMLGKVDNKFCVVAVCVGAASFIRRLGIKSIMGYTKSTVKEYIIPWKSVERLEPEFHQLHIKVQKDKISDLHPEDIADIMEDLSQTQQILIFNSLDDTKAAKTLIEAEEDVQDSVLKGFKLEKIKMLLDNIQPDQAADVISLLPDQKAAEILKSLRPKNAAQIKKILNYHPKVVGSIMKTEFIALPANYTVQETIKHLRSVKPLSSKIYHIYVVDSENHLVGVLSLRALLISEPDALIGDIMGKDVIFIKDNSTKETAARLLARYDLFVLPVVDDDKILRGIVKADDVLDEYLPERLKREKFLPLRLRK